MLLAIPGGGQSEELESSSAVRLERTVLTRLDKRGIVQLRRGLSIDDGICHSCTPRQQNRSEEAQSALKNKLSDSTGSLSRTTPVGGYGAVPERIAIVTPTKTDGINRAISRAQAVLNDRDVRQTLFQFGGVVHMHLTRRRCT